MSDRSLLVDPGPLLALRAMIDQVLAGSFEPGQPCAVLCLQHHQRADKRPWVAELVITTHGVTRSFLRGRKDYSEVDKKGRGLQEQWVLRPGCIYEVQSVVGARGRVSVDRWCCRVIDGEIEPVTPEEQQRWCDAVFVAAPERS